MVTARVYVDDRAMGVAGSLWYVLVRGRKHMHVRGQFQRGTVSVDAGWSVSKHPKQEAAYH